MRNFSVKAKKSFSRGKKLLNSFIALYWPFSPTIFLEDARRIKKMSSLLANLFLLLLCCPCTRQHLSFFLQDDFAGGNQIFRRQTILL